MTVNIETIGKENSQLITLYERQRNDLLAELRIVDANLAKLREAATKVRNGSGHRGIKLPVNIGSSWKEKIQFSLEQSFKEMTSKEIFDDLVTRGLAENKRTTYNGITSILASENKKVDGIFKAHIGETGIRYYELKKPH